VKEAERRRGEGEEGEGVKEGRKARMDGKGR
jgi:hypothetical protein